MVARSLRKGEIIPFDCDFMFNRMLGNPEHPELLISFLSFYFAIPEVELSRNITIVHPDLTKDYSQEYDGSVDLIIKHKRLGRLFVEIRLHHDEQEVISSFFQFFHRIEIQLLTHDYSYFDKCFQINFDTSETFSTNPYDGLVLSPWFEVHHVSIPNCLYAYYDQEDMKLNALRHFASLLTTKDKTEFRRHFEELTERRKVGNYIKYLDQILEDSTCQQAYFRFLKEKIR